MKRKYLATLVILFIFLSFYLVAQESERRTALVIGNSAYSTSPLRNPANDAQDTYESASLFADVACLLSGAQGQD